MVHQILLRQINLRSFLKVFREEYCPCYICSRCYVLDNGDSYSRLLLVFLPMVIDNFNERAHAYSLGIVAQIKYMG
jgi:hypothetical protein